MSAFQYWSKVGEYAVVFWLLGTAVRAVAEDSLERARERRRR